VSEPLFMTIFAFLRRRRLFLPSDQPLVPIDVGNLNELLNTMKYNLHAARAREQRARRRRETGCVSGSGMNVECVRASSIYAINFMHGTKECLCSPARRRTINSHSRRASIHLFARRISTFETIYWFYAKLNLM
jgi:hypothetical protein